MTFRHSKPIIDCSYLINADSYLLKVLLKILIAYKCCKVWVRWIRKIHSDTERFYASMPIFFHRNSACHFFASLEKKIEVTAPSANVLHCLKFYCFDIKKCSSQYLECGCIARVRVRGREKVIESCKANCSNVEVNLQTPAKWISVSKHFTDLLEKKTFTKPVIFINFQFNLCTMETDSIKSSKFLFAVLQTHKNETFRESQHGEILTEFCFYFFYWALWKLYCLW